MFPAVLTCCHPMLLGQMNSVADIQAFMSDEIFDEVLITPAPSDDVSFKNIIIMLPA